MESKIQKKYNELLAKGHKPSNDVKQTKVHIEDPKHAADNLENVIAEINKEQSNVVGERFGSSIAMYQFEIKDGMIDKRLLFKLDGDDYLHYSTKSYEEQIREIAKGVK